MYALNHQKYEMCHIKTFNLSLIENTLQQTLLAFLLNIYSISEIYYLKLDFNSIDIYYMYVNLRQTIRILVKVKE